MSMFIKIVHLQNTRERLKLLQLPDFMLVTWQNGHYGHWTYGH